MRFTEELEYVWDSLCAFWKRLRSRHQWLRGWRLVLLAAIAILLVGGHRWLQSVTHPSARPVGVIEVKQETVPLYHDYVAQTVAINMVDIRARVEGFLTELPFEEGSDVKENDLIFVIDEKPFQAKLDEAQGQLAKDEAALVFANDEVKRYEPLAKKEYITREDFENYKTKAQQAQAVVDSDIAAVEQAALNLGYCRMFAPIDGRIGRTYVTLGNLVGAGDPTKLATIVQLDPLYVYWSPSDEEIHDILVERQKGELEIEVLFSDGTIFPHKGKVDFIDNKVDAKTSTVAMRAVVPNPEKTLLPGIFVSARLTLGTVENAELIPERAIAEDQGGKYVYVVNADDVVEQRSVKLGARYDDSIYAKEGLAVGERIILEGLQYVKPGMTVVPRPAGPHVPGLRELALRALLERPKREHK
jgi:RND family efflux transporter MFP subunit